MCLGLGPDARIALIRIGEDFGYFQAEGDDSVRYYKIRALDRVFLKLPVGSKVLCSLFDNKTLMRFFLCAFG